MWPFCFSLGPLTQLHLFVRNRLQTQNATKVSQFYAFVVIRHLSLQNMYTILVVNPTERDTVHKDIEECGMVRYLDSQFTTKVCLLLQALIATCHFVIDVSL